MWGVKPQRRVCKHAPISVIMCSRAVMACGCLLRSPSMISLPDSKAWTSCGFSNVFVTGGAGLAPASGWLAASPAIAIP